MLISGPPGLGKTTLAHIVAKQAGYKVFEINARLDIQLRTFFFPLHLRKHSDARSAQVVDERIRPALECGSTIGNSRPTLLVVDEIDGATGGTETVSYCIVRLNPKTHQSTVEWFHTQTHTTDFGQAKEET